MHRKSTINYCSKRGYTIPYAIFHIKGFSNFEKRKYRRNYHLWTLEDKAKQERGPILIGKTPIFVSQENEPCHRGCHRHAEQGHPL